MKRLLLLITICISSVSFGQVPSYVPTNGLVGWWGFNGNANDESGNGNNGTINGVTLTTDRFGNLNSAYTFGVSQSINVGNLSNLGNNPTNYSQGIWIRMPALPSGVNSRYPLLSKRHNNSGADWMGLRVESDGKLRIFADDALHTNAVIGESGVLNTNEWIYVVGTKDGNVYTLYINGARVVSIIDSHAMGGSSMDMIFGAQLAWSNYFEGDLDDIGIWNRALDSTEVQALYHRCMDSVQSQPMSNTFQTVQGTAYFTTVHSDTNATYQWQQNSGTGWTDLSDFGIYSGTTTDSLVLTGITTSLNGYGYRCIIDACTMDTTDVAYLTVIDDVGVEESVRALTISPNPTTGLVSVDLSGITDYIIYNMTGQKVAEGRSKGQIDVTNLPTGSYQLIINMEGRLSNYFIQKL